MQIMTTCLSGIGVLCICAFTSPALLQNTQSNVATDSIVSPVVGPEAYHRETSEKEAALVSQHVSVSNGFTDASFPYEITVSAGLTPDELVISSDAERSIQYTMSNVDGKILVKRFFRQEQNLPISELAPGQYALYFFAGKKVVRAVLVDKLKPATARL